MKKALIIGCGYVGRAVAKLWREKGYFVTATTTTPEKVEFLKNFAQKVLLFKGNDLNTLQSLLEGQEVVLFSVGAKSADAYASTYLETAKTLVQALSNHPSIQQVIYTGSYAVYGNHQGQVVTEESQLLPANPNGEILVETEQVLLSASEENRRIAILRLGGIYGIGRELIKIFGRSAGSTRPGTGQETTNWIHLDDIIGAIDFVAQQQLSGIYNLVDDSHLPQQELLDRLFEVHNLPKVSWDANLESPRAYYAWVSNQKIKDAGYHLLHPQITFK